jgi:hypothetical protein
MTSRRAPVPIPRACRPMRMTEILPRTPQPGLSGGGDLTAKHAWSELVGSFNRGKRVLGGARGRGQTPRKPQHDGSRPHVGMSLARSRRHVAEAPPLRCLGDEWLVWAYPRCRENAAVIRAAGTWTMCVNRTTGRVELRTTSGFVVLESVGIGLARHHRQVLDRNVLEGVGLVSLDRNQLPGAAACRTRSAGHPDRCPHSESGLVIVEPIAEVSGGTPIHAKTVLRLV